MDSNLTEFLFLSALVLLLTLLLYIKPDNPLFPIVLLTLMALLSLYVAIIYLVMLRSELDVLVNKARLVLGKFRLPGSGAIATENSVSKAPWAPFRFMDLSPELRNRVYHFASHHDDRRTYKRCTFVKHISKDEPGLGEVSCTEKTYYVGDFWNHSHVCRTIRNEFRPLYLKNTPIRLAYWQVDDYLDKVILDGLDDHTKAVGNIVIELGAQAIYARAERRFDSERLDQLDIELDPEEILACGVRRFDFTRLLSLYRIAPELAVSGEVTISGRDPWTSAFNMVFDTERGSFPR
ncbi:hypothetical protein BU23DRAFT_575120 [Bimuria novae-zelandiae CBS 107.79]|uniref:Uncharacterized protein n=1 Tax=Bimuria novae-zelandiae CBS 107.79 TaxID=1447943 RepID=A0A6A5UJQ6_9PLEO|nr:hypothetical protein BU23DRAFT_575120 [Bimuria novae-zelandiae CBS 107.79]